jgi:glutaredoxin
MEVVLYVQRGCVPCHEARAWLAASGVAFEERDVTINPFWLAELMALGSRVAPTLVVTGPGGRTIVKGFHPEEIRLALAEHADVPPVDATG